MFFANVYPTYINYKSTNIKKRKNKKNKNYTDFFSVSVKKKFATTQNNLPSHSPKFFFGILL